LDQRDLLCADTVGGEWPKRKYQQPRALASEPDRMRDFEYGASCFQKQVSPTPWIPERIVLVRTAVHQIGAAREVEPRIRLRFGPK